jgi:putative transposase
MTQARKVVVVADEVGVYHCISRCVRRAFICGMDAYSGRNYAHRRAWVRERVQHLSALFGIEVFAYSVMSNHLHLVLRNRPDRVAQLGNREVAERWCRLFPGKGALERGELYDANKLKALLKDAGMLEVVRQRLGDLSWFMRCLNEFLARRANREDGCTGRFWEGRFRCQRLMDTGAMLACMAYVDLNPVRAQIAEGLADSEFTSAYDRVVAQRARVRLEALGRISDPTLEQQRQIKREASRQSEAGLVAGFQ